MKNFTEEQKKAVIDSIKSGMMINFLISSLLMTTFPKVSKNMTIDQAENLGKERMQKLEEEAVDNAKACFAKIEEVLFGKKKAEEEAA